MIAFDLETHLIQPGLLAPPIVCGAFADEYNRPLIEKPGDLFDALVADILVSDSRMICGANIAYDFGCLLAYEPSLLPHIFRAYDEGRVFDVLIAQTLDAIYHGYMRDDYILDPRTQGPLCLPNGGPRAGRYSLEVVVDLVLGRTNAKERDFWRRRYALLEGKPIAEWPAEAQQYPVDDAVNTFEVAQAQMQSLRNLHDMPRQVYAAFCEHLGAMWGLRTDRKTVEDLGIELRAKSGEYLEKFTKLGFYKLKKVKGIEEHVKNTTYIKECVSRAYMGSPPMTEASERFPEGQVSTSRDTLEDSGDELLEQFSEVSKNEKLVNTYLPFVESGIDAPINVKPNVLLNTGRSSYEGLIQLLPRKGKIRECFIARPGTVWCSVDYAAIELSTLAQVCLWTVGYSDLAKAINDDLDPHSLLGSMLTATDYSDFLQKNLAGDEETITKRYAAKAANFGFPGGMGAVKFVAAKRKEGMSVCDTMGHAGEGHLCGYKKVTEWKGRPCSPTCQQCIEAAEELRYFYFAKWLEMRKYHEWINNALQTDDHLEQFVSKRVRGGLTFTSGANTLFQGLAADGAKRALCAVSRECYLDTQSPLFGSRVIIFSHDELILEMPEERAHAAGRRQAEIMVTKMREVVPDVKVKAEPALMRRWYKNAKAVYLNDRLVPWEPSEGA